MEALNCSHLPCAARAGLLVVSGHGLPVPHCLGTGPGEAYAH